jgi:hypothetical protein
MTAAPGDLAAVMTTPDHSIPRNTSRANFR